MSARRGFHAATVLTLMLMASASSPSLAATPAACRVTNLDTGQSFGAVQQAIDAATQGHRLTVEGTCHGTTVIAKDLVISGVESATSGPPVLDGDGLGSVVTVLGVVVTIEDLTIEDGAHADLRARVGGGLTNRLLGTVTLRDVVVRRSGGTFNAGSLTLAGTTRIRGLVVYNYSHRGTLTMNGHSAISGFGGTGVYLVGGSLTMNGHSSIHDNAGGVVASRRCTIVMYGHSSIHDNGSRRQGGGGVQLSGSLTMNDSSTITGNISGPHASAPGGVEVGDDSSLTMNDASTITGNVSASHWGTWPGGVFSFGTLVGVVCAPKPHPNVYDNSPADCIVESS